MEWKKKIKNIIWKCHDGMTYPEQATDEVCSLLSQQRQELIKKGEGLEKLHADYCNKDVPNCNCGADYFNDALLRVKRLLLKEENEISKM